MSDLSADYDAPECNGLCVMAYEILEGYSGVAYPHPDCEKHLPRRTPPTEDECACGRVCGAEPEAPTCPSVIPPGSGN